MSTVLMTRAQAHSGGEWVTRTSEFLSCGASVPPLRPRPRRARPLNRIPLRKDAGTKGDQRQEGAPVPVAFARPATGFSRLPVPALDPPDRAESRLILTLSLLAAGALWEVLSSTGAFVTGWDRFVELAMRLLG